MCSRQTDSSGLYQHLCGRVEFVYLLEGIIFILWTVILHFVCTQERDLGDEYGWKQVHGDVFRPTTHPMLFSATIGTGYQIVVVSLCVIVFAIVGELYTE